MTVMTPEERFERIERQLEFSTGILAQLCDSQQRQDAEIAHNSRQISQLAEAVSTLARICDEQGDRIEAGFKRMEERQALTDEQIRLTDEHIRRTDEQMKRTDERMKRTDEQMKRTDEQMKRTDERLNALISMVERHLSAGGQ